MTDDDCFASVESCLSDSSECRARSRSARICAVRGFGAWSLWKRA